MDLDAWINRGANRRQRRLHAAMYACVREDVAVAIAQGYNLHTIWEWLHDDGRFPASYQTFYRYVRRDHQGSRRDKPVQRVTHPPPAAVMPPPEPKPAATPRDDIGGFTMNRKTDKELI